MVVCAVDGCTGTVSAKFSAERVTVDGQFVSLCPPHAQDHKRRFKVRPPHGTKLFLVEVPNGREPKVWLVRETSKLRARKVVLTKMPELERETILGKATYVRAVNPDNIQTGVIMVGGLA